MPSPDPAIKVSSLSKVYPLYNSPRDRLKEAIHPMRKKYHHDFYALRDVSFQIEKGETLGIIGQNGSGKSTLLKILSNVLTPTSGNVMVNGKDLLYWSLEQVLTLNLPGLKMSVLTSLLNTTIKFLKRELAKLLPLQQILKAWTPL